MKLAAFLLCLFCSAFCLQAPIGINLNGLAYYSPAYPFVDAFKTSMVFISQNASSWSDPRALAVDSNGWVTSLLPGQFAGTLLLRGIVDENGKAHYPAGTYTVVWEGDGTLEFSFDAKVVSQQPGKAILDVTPSGGGIYIKIVQTNTNYIKNIQVYMPGFQPSGTTIFHPDYISLLTKYVKWNTLRFMDWLGTNNSPNKDWADRTTPSSQTQAGETGVAWEYIIEICNTLKVNAWINIPHLATNDYITQLASMLKSKLDPSLTIYIEHSNECWNSLFAQAIYCQQMGLKLNLSTNAYEAQLRFHSEASVNIFNIFTTVYGDTKNLFFVLGTQYVNSWVSEQVCSWKDAFKYANGLAIATYWDASSVSDQDLSQMTPEQICNVIKTQGMPFLHNHTQIQQNYAKSVNLQLVAYEGGSGLTPPYNQYRSILTTKYNEVSRNPCMTALYIQSLQDWNTITESKGLLNEFSLISGYGQYGDWGLLEWVDQNPPDVPKFAGVYDWWKSGN